MACEQKQAKHEMLLLDVAIFSSPGAGHVIPFCELCQRLATDFGCKITFILYKSSQTCPKTAARLNSLKSSAPEIELLLIPDPEPPNQSLLTTDELLIHAALSCEEPVRRLVRERRPACLITDIFCTNLIDAAAEEGIPTHVFVTSSAAFVAVMLETPALAEHIRTALKHADFGIQFPGLPCLPARRFPELMTEDPSGPLFQAFRLCCVRFRRAGSICINTFNALEGTLLALLPKRFGGCVPPLYAVGPIVSGTDRTKPEPEAARTERTKPELETARTDRTQPETETARTARTKPEPETAGREQTVWEAGAYLKWLDLQPDRSVVYVSFGSGAAVSAVQIGEIARGLEMSGCGFLWVVQRPADDPARSYFEATEDDGRFVEAALPVGFTERTRNRGLTVPSWVAQMDVLSHAAVGGFVSHCGWNSVLESIVCGVPVVAWPMFAEQHINGAVISDVFRVGIRVRMDDDGFVSGEELQRCLGKLMQGKAGTKARERVKQLQKEACKALKEGGTSSNAMRAAVTHWKSAVYSRNGKP